MSAIAHHLVRRGIDVTQQHYQATQDGQDEPEIKRIALWGVILLWATVLLYMAVVAAISYTYNDVVATLTMIETPTATAFKTSAANDEYTEVDAPLLSEVEKSEKENLQALEADLFLVKQPPVTAKLRTAVKHLRTVAGPWSRFRGLHIALIYSVVQTSIVHFFAPNPSSLLHPLVTILTTIGLCRIQMTWTHTVISTPSPKRWYRRFPSFKAAKNIILPTAVCAIAQQAALYVPSGLSIVVIQQLKHPESYGGNPGTVQKLALVQFVFVILIAISSIVLIVIPANVTLKRVQASMLPEEDESIVSFDRSFDGKVKPEILGGSGCVSMLDAWKTFDKESRIRLLKLYVKVFAIQVATTLMFLMIGVAELRVIMGDDFNKAIKLVHDAMKDQH